MSRPTHVPERTSRELVTCFTKDFLNIPGRTSTELATCFTEDFFKQSYERTFYVQHISVTVLEIIKKRFISDISEIRDPLHWFHHRVSRVCHTLFIPYQRAMDWQSTGNYRGDAPQEYYV